MYKIKLKNGKTYLTDIIWRTENGVILDSDSNILDIKYNKIDKIEEISGKRFSGNFEKCS